MLFTSIHVKILGLREVDSFILKEFLYIFEKNECTMGFVETSG